jgi:hypothetical protein
VSTQNSKADKGPARSALAERMAAAAASRVRYEETTLMGEAVLVSGMTAGEKHRVMDIGYGRVGGKTVPIYAKLFPALVLQTVRDPATKERIFADSDVALVDSLDSEEVDRVATIALRLSGMDGAAVEAGKDDSPAPADA